MPIKIYCLLYPLLFSFFIYNAAEAQLIFSGQVRIRSEVRDGQGIPQKKDTVPAFFTSQRTRLNVGYSAYRFRFYASIQDVRVWGQDASSINRTSDNSLIVHEAWGEISLLDTGNNIEKLTLKIGRQELVYDDSRLLGNLDWLQQARRHDAALLKFSNHGWNAHVGIAFNQNTERKSNHIYNGIPNGYPASTNGLGAMYKAMQFFYIAKKLSFGNASFLFFKDDFSKYSFAQADSLKKTPIYTRGVFSRYTLGGNLVGTTLGKLGFGISVFYQGGEYRDGTKLNEYLISINTLYAATHKLNIGPGVDITSGNNGSAPSKRNQKFDPLYGTPHKFWGYMDYFYAADGFGASGLIDYYFKAKYKVKDNLLISLDAHHFRLPNAVKSFETGKALNKSLGTEFDFVLSYNLTNVINIEGGYSSMFSTDTMTSPQVKNIKNTSRQSNWAYAMISIKPEFMIKQNYSK